MRILAVGALVSLLFAPPAGAQSNEQVYQPGNGVTDPVLVKEVKPVYPPDAKERRVEGTVELSIVVRSDGTVGDIQVTKSLDPVLDQEATRAVQQWLFRPGMKDRVPVNTRVAVELTFSWRRGTVYNAADTGVTMPVAIKNVNPDYDDEARQERIQGTAKLEGIVETDGTVSLIRVIKPLDERLDRQAIKAFGQWLFNPGLKDGVAVRVRVQVEMTFKLK